MGDFPDSKERIRQWCKLKSHHDGENSFVKALREHSFDDDSIRFILEEIDDVCQHCWDGPPSCQCWNDE